MDYPLNIISILLAASIAFGGAQLQQSEEDEARAVAESFMELIDSGKYEKGWELISEQFKRLEDKEGFVKFYRDAHKRFGKVVSRKPITTERQDSSPDEPILRGFIFTYKSVFERDGSIEETIGVFLEQDGRWHVGAYIIENY